jgi:AraC-like DNA-binding protein
MALPAPLRRYRVLATSQLDEARDQVARYFWPHRIELEGRGRQLAASFHHAPVARSSLNFIRYGADSYIDAGEQPDCFMFKLTARGPLEALRSRAHHALRPGEMIVSGPHCHLRVRFADDTGLLIFKVPRETLERGLANLVGDDIARPVAFRDGPIAGAGPMASVIRGLQLLRAELDDDDSLARHPAAAAEYQDFLITALLRAWPHSQSWRLDRTAQAAPRHVKRVVDHIEADPGAPHTAADLVAISGVGASALYEAFRRHQGCSPGTYLREARLRRARTDLKRPGGSATVTDIALRWGFSHLGRFSAQYRAAFGESPSQTLRRAR